MSAVQLPTPPPIGFRPTAATDPELARYGFPPRPAPGADRRLARMWAETFGRDVPFTLAQFTPAPHSGYRSRRLSIIEGESNWAGVVVLSQAGSSINLGIAATWNVPDLALVGSGTGYMGMWVGLAGYTPNALGLLQAGVGGSIDATGAPVFFAWTEWLAAQGPPQPANQISNFPVIHVGDIVETQIWVTSPTTATVVMQNLSSGSPAAGPVIVPLTAPAGVHVVGDDAEWIVEKPVIDISPTDGSLRFFLLFPRDLFECRGVVPGALEYEHGPSIVQVFRSPVGVCGGCKRADCRSAPTGFHSPDLLAPDAQREGCLYAGAGSNSITDD